MKKQSACGKPECENGELLKAAAAVRKAKLTLDTAKWGSKEQASAAHAYQAATRNLVEAALSVAA